MATQIEERVDEIETRLSREISALDQRVEQLTARISDSANGKDPKWWKRIVGIYRNDPEFDEAERLGREYRQSLKPDGEVEP